MPGRFGSTPPPHPDFLKIKWCNLVHSRAHFSLQNFVISEVKLKTNVAFADKSAKNNLDVI